MIRAIVIVVGACLLAVPTQAQSVEARLSADSVTVGDRFALTLRATHPFASEPAFPDTAAGTEVFGDVEVLGIRSLGSRTLDDGRRLDSIVYEATTFALDTAQVPAVPVQFFAEVEAETLSVASATLLLPVISLVPPEAQGIRDLAPLVEFPRPLWPYVLLGLALLLLIATLVYYLRERRRTPAEAPTPPPPPPISPYDEAVNRLRALEGADLTDAPRIKPYYIELSETLRTYLERRLGVPALERTTRELMDEIDHPDIRHQLPGPIPNRIRDVLTLADLVKFADIKPAPEQGRDALQEARQAINATETKLHQIAAHQEKEPAMAMEE